MIANDIVSGTSRSDDDIWSSARDYQSNNVELGTVGWDDDTDDSYYSQGTSEDDGHVLVHVQLFRGRGLVQADETKDASLAQGRKLVCNVSSTLFRIPPRGTRCYVALPSGYENIPGAGVIFATVEKNPFLQFNRDRCAMWFGDDTHLVIRAKSITLTDPGSRFIMIGTSRAGGNPMLIAQDETGSGWTVQSGVVGVAATTDGAMTSLLQLTGDEASIVQTDGAQLTLKGGDFIGAGSNFYAMGAGVYLGPAATALTTALYGPIGISGLPSAHVFISP